MRICKTCGCKVNAGETFCAHCGTQLNEENVQIVKDNICNYAVENESQTLGICAIIFSILGGWLGLILSIVGLSTYKQDAGKHKCKIALAIFITEVVIFTVLRIVLAYFI